MALEQKLSLKLSQKLVMTPSLQQAIKLLQMTRMELEGAVAQELVENPVLEESPELDRELEQAKDREKADAAESEREEQGESMDAIDFESYFGDYMEGSSYASTYEAREGPPLENTLQDEPNLADHLLWQLQMDTDLQPLRREIAEAIVGNLNGEGFLRASMEEIQALGTFSEHVEADFAGRKLYPIAEVEAALALVRNLDPPGIACADLQESLLEQLKHRRLSEWGTTGDPLEPALDAPEESAPELSSQSSGAFSNEHHSGDPGAAEIAGGNGKLPHHHAHQHGHQQSSELMLTESEEEAVYSLARRVLADYWPSFLKRHFPAIAKDVGISLNHLKPAIDLIRTLDPRPGRGFSGDRPHYVEPDVAVVKVSGKYVIQLNDDGMPKLRISGAYRRMLREMSQKKSEKEARDYIKEKMRSAVWLIKSLDQRQRTIYKVANSLIQQQQDFLDHGISRLKPMVLRDVAEDIGMHESTVSRVVSNKYIHTPRGLYPLKFFFHSGIDREYGDNISSLSVKQKIQQMIEGENPKKPLSDNALMKALKREGIQIARRTVAKYRDELGIPSSTDRKKIF